MTTFTFTARTSLGSWFAFTGPWKAELLNNGELCRVLRIQGWDWLLQIEKRIGWREFLQNSTLLQNWTKNMKFTFSNSSYPASEKDKVMQKLNPRFDRLTWSSNPIEVTTGQVRLLTKRQRVSNLHIHPFFYEKNDVHSKSFQNHHHHHDDRLWQPKNNAAVDLFISWWITAELNSLWQTCLYQCNDRCWDFITNILFSRPSIFCITVRIPWVHLKEKQTKHINLFEAPEHINLFQHQGGHLWKWVQCLVELLVRSQALVVLPNSCSFCHFLAKWL